MSEFWGAIEQARADAAADGTAWPHGSAIGTALTDRLSRLPPERLVEFHQCFSRVVRRAHQWDLCAAAFVIWDHISDDGFSDFKAGLVGLGLDAFEQVVAAPDTLADHPLVRAIAAGQADPFTLAGETIAYAAPAVYASRTGDADAFWDAVGRMPAEPDEEQTVPRQRWSGRFGGPEDAARIPSRLPRLHQLFTSAATGST